VVAIKCAVEEIGRLKNIVLSGDFPTAQGADVVILRKADVRALVQKDTRTKDIEAVVSSTKKINQWLTV
jgi:hypothetical protein